MIHDHPCINLQGDAQRTSLDRSQDSIASASKPSGEQNPSKESLSSGSEGRSQRRFTSPFVLAAQAPYTVDEDSDSDARSVSMQSQPNRAASGNIARVMSTGAAPRPVHHSLCLLIISGYPVPCIPCMWPFLNGHGS